MPAGTGGVHASVPPVPPGGLDGRDHSDLPPAAARDDEVLIREARELFPVLRLELAALLAELPVPPRWADKGEAQATLEAWFERHPTLNRPTTEPAHEAFRAQRIKDRLTRLRGLLHLLEGDDTPSALCLSGGGIRSATFSLGVIQGLASKEVMQDFHYVSTVSGGGYSGCMLSAWIRNEALEVRAEPSTGAAGPRQDIAALTASGEARPQPVPMTPEEHEEARGRVLQQLAKVGRGQAEEPQPLRRLRAFSNYLTPMRGISADALTLLAIYARNLTLNWLVLIPAILVVLALPRLYLAVLLAPMPPPWFCAVLGALAALLVTWTIAFMASDLPAPPTTGASERYEAERLTSLPPERPAGMFLPMVLPLLVAAALVSCLVAWGVRAPAEHWVQAFRRASPELMTGVCFGLGFFIQGLGSMLGGGLLRRRRHREAGVRPADKEALIAVVFAGGLTGVGLYWLVVWIAGFSPLPTASSWRLETPPALHHDIRAFAWSSVPLLMTLFWLGVTLYAGWRRPKGLEDEREWWARAAGLWIGWSLVWTVGCGVVFYLPGGLLTATPLKSFTSPESLGAGTGALGALVAIVGFLSKHGPAWREKVESVAATTGMRLFDLLALVFIVLFLAGMSYAITATMRFSDELTRRQDQRLALDVRAPAFAKVICTSLKMPGGASAPTLGTTCRPLPCGHEENSCAHWADIAEHRYTASLLTLKEPCWLLLAMVLAGGLSWLASRQFGVNAFSLHSLYGNRLVRAYLAASRQDRDRRPHWFTGFDPKDDLPVHETWPKLPPHAGGRASASESEPGAPSALPRPRLMQVVNIALNLVKPSGKRLEWQDRKAAAFTVTPLFAGSAATGYIPSWAYLRSPYLQGISLGGAMTLSGAAASPNMGYHSSAPLAIVMTLFNVRLGKWLPNPRWLSKAGWPPERDEPSVGLRALYDEAVGSTSDDTRHVYLSDGGHFDNTGLYEMVRRRVRRIVFVDAVADPDYQFDDLLSTVRRIRIDMGITIEFISELPGPKDKGRSGAAVGLAHILYAQADPGAPVGELVLIKPVLVPDDPAGPWLPLDVRRYAKESARGRSVFPQQPTSDQFFDEAQFESYRMLGLHTVRDVYDRPRKPHDDGGPPPPKRPLRGFADLVTAVIEEKAAVPPSPEVPPLARTEDRHPSRGAAGGFKSLLPDSAGTIAATALVSAVTVTGAVALVAPSEPVRPGDKSTVPVISDPASPPPGAASTALDTFVKQVGSAASAAESLSGAATEAASAARAASDALQGVVLIRTKDGTVNVKLEGPQLGQLAQAVSDSKLTAEKAASAAEAAATSASHSSTAAQKAAEMATALGGATGQVARVNQTLKQSSRGGVRSGEGAAP
ncbi:hypothetical protein CS062_07130 [Roseateles chitinivorans]|uniref:PNPLA domain-containing protein n=2 Tax=Roseateles chitinivorans TaxID=2917965 RepID=A0A2G9CBZ1_9BURK|nr:hypothetical protein CS062_07130 [Roseateles chitinivorans]